MGKDYIRSSSIQKCIPPLSFAKIVKNIMMSRGVQYRIQQQALDVLQEATEQILIEIFGDSYLISSHVGRVTTFDSDMRLWLRIARPKWAVFDKVM
ncbi:Histone_H3 [Hexamita inflata]|uniref:Histone H3 n=1 Tax=Hexamita inflata TaxID=28002 RepID=A0AA86RKD6_9EUKA|nr:Histone H3 [Hexamita inflata]CAI9978292.1 Histone H3 [Hexamita inflata]